MIHAWIEHALKIEIWLVLVSIYRPVNIIAFSKIKVFLDRFFYLLCLNLSLAFNLSLPFI